MGAFFLMKLYDYIIVGQGLAGTLLAFQLKRLGKRVFVIDKYRTSTSSKVAFGAYNPMVLKRFTACWKVEEQLQPLYDFIHNFEETFQTSIHTSLKLLRKFHSIQEQNLWLEKSEKPRLKPFMNAEFTPNTSDWIHADHGYGEVNHAGRVDLKKMISLFRHQLETEDALLDEDMDYNSLEIEENLVSYKSIMAKKIVFCEGHRLTQSPFFNYLPLMRTKGEIVTVKLDGLELNELIKSNISVLPLGNDEYKVGATFNWEDKDEICTEEAKQELLSKLGGLVKMAPELVHHEAGLRPTVKDRRALLGAHANYSNVFVFNGLGTRGLLISPYLSLQLINAMEQGVPLDPEVDIKRYDSEMTC